MTAATSASLKDTALEAQIRNLRKRVDEAKSRRDELKGGLKAAEKRLKDDFGCSTLKEAEKELEKLTAREGELDEQVREGLEAVTELLGAADA